MRRKIKFYIILCFGVFIAAILSFPKILFAQSDSVECKTGFYYMIQEGDTLWDLSERFSDSPWLWPDLWRKNKQIANPHWIYPGERIRLYNKKWLEKRKGLENKKTEEKKILPFYYYPGISQVGFIKKIAVEPSGTIFKVKYDKEMIGNNDLVYIRPEGAGSLKVGERYTVYRTRKPAYDKETKAYIGIQYYLTGLVEIVKNEPRLAAAKVVRSYRPVNIDDHVMPYEKRDPKIILRQNKKGLEGKVVFSEEREVIFGDHSLAFIDKGKTDGVKPGQLYSIYQQEIAQLDSRGTNVLLPRIEYGNLIVLHTEQTTSTVLITRSDKSIEEGARICCPLQKKW